MKASELKVGDIVCYDNDDNRAFGDMLVTEWHEHVFTLFRPHINLDGPILLAVVETISVHETSNLKFAKRRFSPFYAEKLTGKA